MMRSVLTLGSICLLLHTASIFAAPAPLPPAPDGVVIEQNISYLPPDRAEKLDLYLPAAREKSIQSPAVVIIHGGGWSGGEKSASREFNIGTTLAKAGYVCASVEYMKQPGKRWPTNLLDCKNAVRFLRAKANVYQIDVDHIGVIGGSAGGHLALMVSYSSGVKELEPETLYPGISDQVQACVDMYGVSDLLTRKNVDKQGNPTGPATGLTGLFSETREEHPELWKLASPVSHIVKSSPPTLILQGMADPLVDRDQSKELDQKLEAAGVEHQLILIPAIGHTFDLQSWNHKPLPQDLRPAVVDFFNKHLRPKQDGAAVPPATPTPGNPR